MLQRGINDFDTDNEFVPGVFELLKSNVTENEDHDNELEIEFGRPEAEDDEDKTFLRRIPSGDDIKR